MENQYPKIYLAADNCYATKRWTAPADWCRLTAELGVNYIEASADTELDPLYMGPEYLKDWVRAVQAAQREAGVRVANLYSGHGTYTTLGLAHTDERVRRRMVESWFKPMIDTAARLGAGLGFFAHAFPDWVLQSPAAYAGQVEILTGNLAELNHYAGQVGCGPLGLEQMYTPHQYPYTISQTRRLLREVTSQSGRPFYFTEDVGHHQQKFRRPGPAVLQQYAKALPRGAWLGSQRAYELAEAGASAARLADELDQNPHLFATEADGSYVAWLEQLGCYSPIIHLQQTDGASSAHLPFTQAQNQKGIVTGPKLLRALKKAYDQPEEAGMPKRCEAIFLTLELFCGTAAIPRDFLRDYAESVAYWRQFVPKDGLALDALCKTLPDE